MKFFRPGNVKLLMKFHTYLSDGKQQDSLVVNNHMEELIQFLLVETFVKVEGMYTATAMDVGSNIGVCLLTIYQHLHTNMKF